MVDDHQLPESSKWKCGTLLSYRPIRPPNYALPPSLENRDTEEPELLKPKFHTMVPREAKPADKLDFRDTHNPTPLQVLTARLSDKRSNFSISRWHMGETAVMGSELGGIGLHRERPRQAHSLSAAPKRICCSKSTCPRGLDGKTRA